jgi:anti-sigma B factor antagonist
MHDFHRDAVHREEVILRYLRGKLESPLVDEFEDHYLFCDECLEEIGATGLLMDGLRMPPVTSSRVGEIAVLRFPHQSQLLAVSAELQALLDTIRERNESRVLIDLSTVSRIDSTGLGVLMSCHCHALQNSGALKLLNPSAPVKAVLQVTRIDSVLETFEDESAAIRSFGPG